MLSSPACDAGDYGSGCTSTISAETVTGWHVIEFKGYSKFKGLGIAKTVKSSTFIVGGHSWCILFFPDGFSSADWVSFALRLEHPAARGDIKVRANYTLLDQVGEPSYTRIGNERIFSGGGQKWGLPRFIKRKELESSYVKDDKFCIRCDVTVIEFCTKKLSMAPPPDLHHHLSDLLASGVGADVTLEVGEETFAAHKSVLAARSSVFKAEFFDVPTKEKVATRVRIHGIAARVFKAMLHFIYTDSLPEIDRRDKIVMAQYLLVAADKYNIERLKLVCKDILRMYINTSKHGCHRPMEARFQFCSPACTTETATGCHVVKVEGYSQINGLGVGKGINSSRFIVGGNSWCITYFPDGSTEENADWICFALCLEHHVTDGYITVRTNYNLLDQDGEPVPSSSDTIIDSVCTFWRRGETGCHRRLIKRKDLESSYVKDDKFYIRCDVTVIEKICYEKSPMVPQPNLHRHLSDLLASGVGVDVTLGVGGETFVAHKNVLAARSSVFKAEFFGGPLKEKAATYVRIHGIEAIVFKAMLHFIYTDSLPEIQSSDKMVMAQHLLVAADRYNMERLKLICEDILCTYMNIRIAASTIVLAEQHGLNRLKDACFKFLKSCDNLNEVLVGDDFQHMAINYPCLLDELLPKVGPVTSSTW